MATNNGLTYNGVIDITKSDTTDLLIAAGYIVAITCEGAGDLVLEFANGGELTIAAEAGAIYPFRPQHVMAATTATGIKGLT